MSNLEIVREQRIAYGETGQVSRSDEIYIKVLASFRNELKQLKGARLHVFMCVALHEAQIVLAATSALTLSSIQEQTGYTKPSIIGALDYLVEHRFLVELSQRGEAGEKQYRVQSFAWFDGGGKKTLPQSKNFTRNSTYILNSKPSSTEEERTSTSTNCELKNFQQGEMPMTTFADQIEELDKPKSKWIPPHTALTKYLAAQKIGKWKHCWKGFASKKEQEEWDTIESLYEPATIRQKIDYFVQRGIPPKFILSRIMTALKENVIPNKPQPCPHVDNRPTARPSENKPEPVFGFQKN